MAVLVDAGPLYAYVDRSDRHHDASLDLLSNHQGPLLVPTLVVSEVCHLIASRLGTEPEVRFLGDIARGSLIVAPVHPADWLRIAELVARYGDLRLGTVDASLIAAAERLDITQIATFDRRDFATVRPDHAEAFELVP